MGFNIGLSGLRAAQTDLSVTGNNIANASTVGFKHSRAEFGDMYAAATMSAGTNRPGMGVRTEQISQQHTQGGFDYTGRALDLAIDGEGYFVMKNNGVTEYTRAGYFDLDKEGFVVNNTGRRLQGYAPGQDNLSDMKVDLGLLKQKSTTKVDVSVNLDSRANLIYENAADLAAFVAAFTAAPGDTTVFNPQDPTNYNYSAPVEIVDSAGQTHLLRQFFIKNPPPAAPPAGAEPPLPGNTWTTFFSLNGEMLQQTHNLEFDIEGNLMGGGDFPLPLGTAAAPNGLGAAPEFEGEIAMNFADMIQYGSQSAVQSIRQDGYMAGQLTGLSVDKSGTLVGRYSNGEIMALGKVAVATFVNPQGLQPIGSTAWAETLDSGPAATNPAGVGRSGNILGGALEQSTVDLAEQLVQMIIGQRNYQANAKTIQAQDAIAQTIINLR